GANYPSTLLSDCLFWIGDRLFEFFNFCNLPIWLNNCLINGIYKVVAWVVAVMLPPMAIFFPLFTLLEDLGVLPRIAFNLDKCFKKANSCGKQALTMCMGFGCNAAAITGCRIIDSKRERLIAILTNNFVPCNGRFPTIISIITLFFVGASGGFLSSISSTFILMCVIICGILMTFLISKFLSKTFLKGVPSSFTLELPPYRAPQIGKVIVRSIFDRTLFVLARAVCIAAPAGLIIWLCANVFIGDVSILNHLSSFFDPFAKLMGLDGVILLAFILGFPANEIVVPIIIMAYLSTGSIMEFDNIWQLKELLLSNGWTITTAICLITFSLFHFPCSTTILTIKKETKSIKWTIFSFILPTIIGITICIIINTISHLFC
ncbi:MAG: nucleoside recognition domain-containing protein, partial [Oscillospiraceae bacterium]